MTEYIDREAAIKALCERSEPCFTESGEPTFKGDYIGAIASVPAADVVPWEWLERYADYFCAGVSMPEFVREAKMFYESTNEAMQGGVIDG